jgi:hypothetical protein
MAILNTALYLVGTLFGCFTIGMYTRGTGLSLDVVNLVSWCSYERRANVEEMFNHVWL